LGLLPLWMRAFFQKNRGSGQKKFWFFFVPNHSIRENKVRKLDFDGKKISLSLLSDLTLSHFRGRKPTFSICHIIYRLILTFGCWIWMWTRFHDIFKFSSPFGPFFGPFWAKNALEETLIWLDFLPRRVSMGK
jgi:hypothetical protein